MASLTAFKFNDTVGAQKLLDLLLNMQKQQLITIQDAAIVTWEAGKKKPKTKELAGTTGAGALSGGFWGLLFGLIFFVPFLGMAIGAGMGALMGHFTDYGINEQFIEEVRKQVVPGTSALFLLSQSSAPDRVIEEVKAAGLNPQLIQSNLSREQEERLREAFAE